MIEVLNRTSQAKGVGNPFRTIPAPYSLDEEWCELGQDHSRPVVTISLGVFIKLLYSFQLLVADGYTNPIIILLRFVELFPAYAGGSEWCDAYTSLVRHDQFCVRVFTLGCPPNDSVMPAALTLVEGYTYLMWFGCFSYPIV
jgi:hypothetical protein